jgi:NAD(P)-dependent dehydrogenase (short-subunit alcohol dehydrogenase family)
VRAFAGQGAHPCFVDISDDAAEALCEEVHQSYQVKPWYQNVDVTNPSDLQAAYSDAQEDIGPISVLVNNVANDTRHQAENLSADDWRKCLAVNLDAAFFAAQAAISGMRKQGGGAIINFSSINAFLGPENMLGYVTAKAGLVGMTKALASDLGADMIRVNAILPGWVATDRQLDLWLTPEAEEDWMKQVALKKRIQPDDVARLCLFLAADDSAMITGQSFIIDGGRT